MNVLLLGSGGREHAMAWKLAQSPRLTKLFVCPGNPGTARVNLDLVENRDISAVDADKLIALCQEEDIKLCIIGPEQPLVWGIADALRKAGILVVGPGVEGARLEGSKVFSKKFMLEAGIPTAPARMFTANQLNEAHAFLENHPLPVVIKADGLASGKGVVVAKTLSEASTAVNEMLLGNRFGDAGRQILIEEFMPGEELSYFVITDGRSSVALLEAQDHKRAYDGDLGPNTGGMGAFSPVGLATPELKLLIDDTIVTPTLAALAKQGISYQGFLFIGLMVDAKGQPRVIEYNCRLGDPETQVILPRLDSDFLELCYGAASATLDSAPPVALVSQNYAVTVVLASEGYPEAPVVDRLVSGLAGARAQGALVFEAGTKPGPSDVERISTGGRVLTLTGMGKTLVEAQKQAYEAMKQVSLVGSFYRKDIGPPNIL